MLTLWIWPLLFIFGMAMWLLGYWQGLNFMKSERKKKCQ